MKTLLSICLISTMLGCYNYTPQRQGYVRPTHDSWYVPSYKIGDHHLQLTLMTSQTESLDSQVVYGAMECFLSDTLKSASPVRKLEFTSLRIIHQPNDTITANLKCYQATLEQREDGTFVGLRADIAPFKLPQSISNIQTILTVRLPGASTDGRDSVIEYADRLHLEKGLVPTPWVTWEPYPYPFSPTNTIEYVVPGEDSAFATLDLYNVTGEKVAVLVNGYQPCGLHKIIPDFTGYPSGIYFYKLTVGTFTVTKKIGLIK